jgi:hypothetical protein
MSTYQFLTSLLWIIIIAGGLGFAAYMILSGRLRWLEYQTGLGKVNVQVMSDLGIKNVSPDEMIAFESFVYRDLSHLERGARLAYIILFVERDLLEAQFENNKLQIELTDKGKKLHARIMSECEKRLMISPKTEIVWKSGEKKVVEQAEVDKGKQLLESIPKK